MKKSELRQDLVSGDWIVIAPGRSRRPHRPIKKNKRKISPLAGCPFEDPAKSGQEKPYLIYPNKHGWAVQVLPNKYPVLSHPVRKHFKTRLFKHGVYSIFSAIGHHDLVISSDHYKNFPRLKKESAQLIFQALRDRYLMLNQDKFTAYVSILHNWGPEAGASIYHPHYQILAIPVVPSDVQHSLTGSSRYFEKHKKCVHCAMIDWELKEKKRIIFENNGAVAFTPYVSRTPFEVRIFPKKHLPYFENTYDHDMEYVVEALQKSLRIIEKRLGDSDYNFFIHTAPVQNKENYRHYHWHIEITPIISIRGGFELGTGIEINDVDPDAAAKILKK